MTPFGNLAKKPVIHFVWQIVNRSGRHRIATHSAALAYFTLLSTVPILFFILSVGSLFVNVQEVRAFSLDTLESLLPVTTEVTRNNIDSLLNLRSTLGVVSGLWALWSCSGMFTALEHAINVVWGQPHARGFWKRRLIGILSLLSLTMWVLFTFVARTMWKLLPAWLPIFTEITYPKWTERGLSFLSIVLLSLALYRFFPARPVDGRWAVGISLSVSLIWVISREAFAWALTAGVLSYPIVYGSLWGLVVPIVWAYWSYRILLTGAEVQAYVEEVRFGSPTR
ncbi:MAG: YihY/virulence factor BrkB family protein [Anaerolineales bacterium]